MTIRRVRLSIIRQLRDMIVEANAADADQCGVPENDLPAECCYQREGHLYYHVLGALKALGQEEAYQHYINTGDWKEVQDPEVQDVLEEGLQIRVMPDPRDTNRRTLNVEVAEVCDTGFYAYTLGGNNPYAKGVRHYTYDRIAESSLQTLGLTDIKI